MTSSKFEQRINLKFLVKLGKNEHEAFYLLRKAYGDHCMSRACVLAYFNEYSKSLEKQYRVEETENVSTRTSVPFLFFLSRNFHSPRDALPNCFGFILVFDSWKAE